MSYTEKSDSELVELCLRGRERAATELVSRFERPLFSVIHPMVRDAELAEDLAQETFVRAFRKLDQYDPEYKFSSWLFKVGYHLTIDHLRKKRPDTLSIHGAPDATTSEQQEATAVTLESRTERPDQVTEARALGEEIERALETLRPEYRAVVILRHVEGRPYAEIAEITELPLGTVKTYLHRARRELREELGHLREEA